MNRLPRSRSAWAWGALGLGASVLLAVAGPQAAPAPVDGWWYRAAIPGGHAAAEALVYAGVALLCVAWIGLGRSLADTDLRQLFAIGAAWLIPLALGPALFSHDAYAYLAQGTVLRLGHDPYHAPPAVLAGLGQGHVLAAVSPFWRHVTAPYGPVFLGLMSLITSVTGSHLVAGVLAVRGLDLLGLVLIAWFLPRLAGALGANRRQAVWLGLLSPLSLVELVSAGHNDVLMVGLLVAGLALAVEGRPLLGVAVCVLAATIKIPALAGAAFIAVAWLREERTRSDRALFLLGALAPAALIVVGVSALTGLGFSWVSSSLFAGPARVRLAITPSTGIGFTLASLLHDLGLSANSRSFEGALGSASTILTGLLGCWLLYRVRISKLVPYLGVLLLVAAAAGPAAWPWYFSWGLVLLAACPGPQRSLALIAGSLVAVFLIKPDGILALPLPTAPAVIAVYLLLAGLFWRSRRGGPGGQRGARQLRTDAHAPESARQPVLLEPSLAEVS